MFSIQYYFNKWKKIVDFKRYDTWCEINDERLKEEEFARNNDLEPVYWCWNCKYNECGIHN